MHTMNLQKTLLPMWIKILYSLFMIVLVPKYLIAYGPTNFLYFCDVALFMTLASLWLENALPASAALVGILLPQLLWQLDFLASLIGLPSTGITSYMFSEAIPVFTRFLSFFHFWLPLFLLWIVHRLGYDRRAFKVWACMALALLFVCYFFMPPPPPPKENPALPVNINYVFGLSDNAPQNWVHPHVYFAFMLVFLPLCVFWPTHAILKKLFPPHQRLSACLGEEEAGAKHQQDQPQEDESSNEAAVCLSIPHGSKVRKSLGWRRGGYFGRIFS